jgi:hypothetical protein
MTHRLRVKVVVGSLRDPAMLRVWEAISKYHDVQILTQQRESQESLTTFLPVVEFPLIADMPGFFRDIEPHLLGADIICGVESSRLYSFQALRVARKFGIPFLSLVHEYEPFIYEKYQNIRAIQHDIYTNATSFLATTNRASKLLELEGVPHNKICKITPVTDAELLSYSESHAQKFRRYVQIPEDSTVLCYFGGLNNIDTPLTVARSLRLALNKVSEEKRANVRLLLCGRGAAAEELKYEVADMGLGRQVLFLAQDPTPFMRDLLSAVDVMIEGRGLADSVSEIPWHLVSAAYAGVRFVVPEGSISAEILSAHTVRKIEDFSPLHLSEALAIKVNKGRETILDRSVRVENAGKVLALSDTVACVLRVIEEVTDRAEHAERREGLVSFVKQYQIPVSCKEAAGVLVTCEELREFSVHNEVHLYSEILRIRGDALMALSRNDEALLAFEDALKQNAKNYHALRGLGYLAWHGHSHEDAMRFFKRALALSPNDYQSLVGVGLVYRRLQMFEESVYWLQKAIAVGGLESTSLNLLVQACLENATNSEAAQVLHSIRDNMGDHPNLTLAIQKLESHS